VADRWRTEASYGSGHLRDLFRRCGRGLQREWDQIGDRRQLDLYCGPAWEYPSWRSNFRRRGNEGEKIEELS
jgi:hypothetical protein